MCFMLYILQTGQETTVLSLAVVVFADSIWPTVSPKDDNCCSWLCSNRVVALLHTGRGSMYLRLWFCACMSVCLTVSLCRCHSVCVCEAFTHLMSFHFLKWDKYLSFFLAWLAFLRTAFGSKASVFYRLFFIRTVLTVHHFGVSPSRLY